MPFRFAALYDVLVGLRRELFPSTVAAAIFDDLKYSGWISGYLALAAHSRWIEGDLPLWAATDGRLEQVSWRPGRFIDWPDPTCDVAIAEYGTGLIPYLMGEDPPLYRREGIATSAAAARRLRVLVRADLRKKFPRSMTSASEAETKQFLRTLGAVSEKEARRRMEKEFGSRQPPRSLWRPVLTGLKQEDEAAFKPKLGRPRKK